jgi:D-aminoacyl-tRNA deacylase
MIAVVQRVLRARVTVGGRVVGRIGAGMLVLAAVEAGDTEAEVEWMAGKLLTMRIFRNGEKHFDLDVGQMAELEDAERRTRNAEPGMPPISPSAAEDFGGGAAGARAGILLVSNFTVAAETGKGRRPSLSHAAAPEQGRVVFEQLLAAVRRQAGKVAVETGEFGAMMEVELVNDGPVTFLVESEAGKSGKK